MTMKNDILIESKSLRESVIDRVDVLDKVKKLSMLPGDIYITIDMVADYYEVDRNVVAKIVTRNKLELLTDGIKVIKGKELSDTMSETENYKLPPTITVLPRRAVLRIGMLLQESEVAKSIRSYLLEKEEEKKSSVSMPENLSPEMQMFHLTFVTLTKNEKEIATLKQNHEQLSNAVTTIQETIIDRDDNWRKSINNMINGIVYRLNAQHADIRNKSYEILEERGHCNLNTRLKNWQKRLVEHGKSKTMINSISRLDVIEDDPKMKEIYTSVIKEMSIGSLKIAK